MPPFWVKIKKSEVFYMIKMDGKTRRGDWIENVRVKDEVEGRKLGYRVAVSFMCYISEIGDPAKLL